MQTGPVSRVGKWFGNTAWSVTGNGFYAACQWAMLVVMARAGNPRLVGQFALGLAISAPVFLFGNLQIRAIQSTDLRGEFRFGEYLGVRLLTTAAALMVVVGIVVAAGYDAGLMRVVLAVSLAKAFEAISDVFHGDLQRRERMDSVARYLIVKGIFSLLAIAAAILLSGNAAVAGLAMAVVFACVLLFGESRRAVASARVIWNWQSFRRLTLMALPLGFVMMLISVSVNMPRYFIENSLGTKALGVFAALTYLSVAATTLINAIGLALTPRLARLYASEDRSSFPLLLFRSSLLAALPCLAGMGILALAGKTILTFVYGPPYAANIPLAIEVMAAGSVSCAASVLGYGLTAARCFRQQVPLFLGVVAVAALAASTLIPLYGLSGAAIGQIAAATAQLFGSAAILFFAMRRGRAQGPPDAALKIGATHPSSREPAAMTCACSSSPITGALAKAAA